PRAGYRPFPANHCKSRPRGTPIAPLGNGIHTRGIRPDAPLEAAVKGIQIGQVLIEQGVLSEKQVAHILKVQKVSPRPFGDLAERLYGISPQAVEDAWVEQYVRIAGVVDLESL